MQGIVFFPDSENVFYENVEGHERVLFPIVSIRLPSLDPNFGDESVHLIQFNEDPYNEEGVKYFSDGCDDRMVSFKIKDHKCKFASDLRFFDLTDEWQEWFDRTRKSYETLREKFKSSEPVFTEECLRIGGQPEWVQEDETPKDSDGDPMVFIAQYFTLYTFDDYCPKTIYLFYSPKQKIATQIYQIS